MSDDLRFEPPGESTGDRLVVIIRRGPDGEAIVDAHVSQNGDGPTTRKLVVSVLRLSQEAREIANERPQEAIEKLCQAVNMLAAFLIARD